MCYFARGVGKEMFLEFDFNTVVDILLELCDQYVSHGHALC
jgi:hypothetical protein